MSQKKGKDKQGREYIEFSWLRITKVNDKFRINAISQNGKVKQGPEIHENCIGQLIDAMFSLK
jgi:hypothetical protein